MLLVQITGIGSEVLDVAEHQRDIHRVAALASGLGHDL